jgi:hypothetical protein
MTVGKIIEFSRFQLDDTQKPYKWSSEELVLYHNDAEAEACRRGNLIHAYPSVVTITGNSNISFATTKKITKSTGGFLSAGTVSELETFEIDDQITITGTVSNNGVKTISNVTDTEITVIESLVAESNKSATIEATRTATRLPLRAGVHTYRLHPKTLMVYRARPESLTYPLRQRTLEGLDADILVVDTDLDDMVDSFYYESWEELTNYLFSYIEDSGKIRIVSPPIVDDILWMFISRLPKKTYTINDFDLTPEIPEPYHMGLVDWILHRAYMKQDGETQDLTKAKSFEASFESRFGKRPSAIQEMNRKLYPRNTSFRPRSFGF